MDKQQLQTYLDSLSTRQASIQGALQQAQAGVNQLTQELIHINGAISAVNEMLSTFDDLVEAAAPTNGPASTV